MTSGTFVLLPPAFAILRLIYTVLALGTALVCRLEAETVLQQANISSETTLCVGMADISRYAVEKNLARVRRAGGKDDAAVRSWFELFLARQVMIAEALQQGYAKRPEVMRVVASMERQMLFQLEGTPAPPTATEVRTAYDQAPIFPGSTKPPFEQLRPVIEQTILQRRRMEMNQARREQALQAAALTFSSGTAEELIRRIQAQPLLTKDISKELIGSLAEAPLATYRSGDETLTLTVESWCDYFNHLFVRALPADLTQLRASIQDLVVMEYACREARRRGLDQAPQFVEDRRNFLYYQALDLFEKEALRPLIAVTPPETEVYYREHQSEFVRPARAHGKLLHFSDPRSAFKWLADMPPTEVSDGDETVVSREAPIPGAEKATEQILQIADGRAFGPIHVATGSVIFWKRTTEPERQSYAAVLGAIQEKLIQAKLDALEISLAREWAPRYLIEDNLHPEDFGIVGSIRKPWSGL
jgi:hypothetical protein